MIFSDLSLDLETMGTQPGSAIVALGACFFDTATSQIGEKFYRAIHLSTAVREGLAIDPATLMWWLRQSDAAREAIIFNTYDIRQVLTEFAAWVNLLCPKGSLRVWARGPSFDCSLLMAAYRACDIAPPWLYFNERCHRTLTARNPSVPEPEREGTYHRADDDAVHQAKWLIAIAEAQRARK